MTTNFLKHYIVSIVNTDESFRRKLLDILREVFKTTQSTYNIHFDNDFDNLVPAITETNGKSQNFNLVVVNLPYLKIQDYQETILKKAYNRETSNIKILIVTDIVSPYVLRKLLKNINPDGFITLPEVGATGLKKNIVEILLGNTQYSPNILKIIRNESRISHKLDERDHDILYMLSTGRSTKEIRSKIGMAPTTLEKRLMKIGIQLGINNSKQKELIQRAKKVGII